MFWKDIHRYSKQWYCVINLSCYDIHGIYEISIYYGMGNFCMLRICPEIILFKLGWLNVLYFKTCPILTIFSSLITECTRIVHYLSRTVTILKENSLCIEVLADFTGRFVSKVVSLTCWSQFPSTTKCPAFELRKNGQVRCVKTRFSPPPRNEICLSSVI